MRRYPLPRSARGVAVEQPRWTRRRVGRSVLAAASVAGLLCTAALSAVTGDVLDGDSSFAVTVREDVQRLTVGAGVAPGRAKIDGWLRSRPAASWQAPVSGELRDGFGPRLVRPVAGVSPMHRGQDIGARCGQQVRAASDGVVVQAGWYGTYGNWVMLDHGGGLRTGYAHNASLTVRVGDRVSGGQVIAVAGTTGASSGCHVHLEVRQNAAAVDPRTFMQARGVSLG